MSVEASRDLEDLFRLNITIDTAADVITEARNFSARALGTRQVKRVKRWKNTTCLGWGTSGTVRLQVEEDAPENCRAVKDILKGTSAAPLLVNYRRELLALGRLSERDDIFVQFLGWYEDSWSVYLVMEYFEHGDLGRHLSTPLIETDVQAISKQLLEGLAVLHGQGWAHRDLKPANIFVVEKSPWWVKIGDFGISKRIRSGNTKFQAMIGTPEFLAPEVLNLVSQGYKEDASDEEDEYTVAVDMWSLGCVIYQILTLGVPFTGNRRKLRSYCRSKVDKFPIASLSRLDVSAAAVGILRELLEPHPSARMTVDTALVHPWVQEAQEIPDNQRRSLRRSVHADIGLPKIRVQEGNRNIVQDLWNIGQEANITISKEASIKTDWESNIMQIEQKNKKVPIPDLSSGSGYKKDPFRTHELRVTWETPCHGVLPQVLKMYNIIDDWRAYYLYIVHGDSERCLGREERPLQVLKQLERKGPNPTFMLRKNPKTSEKAYDVGTNQRPGDNMTLNQEASMEIDAEAAVRLEQESSTETGHAHDTARSVEIFKSFRISIDDSCHRVLPAALEKYNINDDSRNYALDIVYGDGQERCLGLDEKPLVFKQLDREGLNPMFLLRKHRAPEKGFT